MSIKTPEQVVQEAFDAYSENLTPEEREEFLANANGNWRSLIVDVIETDRAQRPPLARSDDGDEMLTSPPGLQIEVEETIADNAKIEAAFQNARDLVGSVIVPDEHDPRL